MYSKLLTPHRGGSKRASRISTLALLLFSVCITSLLSVAHGQTSSTNEETVGQLLFAHGNVSLTREQQTNPAQRGLALFNSDIIQTEAASSAQIRFRDNALVAIRPNSVFAVSSYHFDENDPASGEQKTQLIRGSLRAVTGAIGRARPENVEFQTPVATMGIRGTVLSVVHVPAGQSATYNLPTGTFVMVEQGSVLISNAAGAQLVSVGEAFWVPDADTPPVPAPPEAVEYMQSQNTQQEEGSDDSDTSSNEDESLT